MSISRLEQETIITFNEAEQTTNVYTHNGAFIRKLDRLCTERPNEVKCLTAQGAYGNEYEVPKKYVKINAGIILSTEDRAKRAKLAMQRFGHTKEAAK